MQVVYGLIFDCGDGTSTMIWFKNKDLVERLSCNEEFYQSEGEPSETLKFPDDFDLEAAGFRFSDDDWKDS